MWVDQCEFLICYLKSFRSIVLNGIENNRLRLKTFEFSKYSKTVSLEKLFLLVFSFKFLELGL
jgi:hypothetical protein